MTEPTFQADPQIVAVAEAYAQDAVDLAADNFGVELDWSEAGVREVEQMLGRLHDELASAAPDEETVSSFAKAFGSYLGEVLRQHHGGKWGLVTMDGESIPALQQPDGGLIWPWSKVHKRITNGAEDNVWHYYQILIRGEESEPSAPVAIAQKPWWKLW